MARSIDLPLLLRANGQELQDDPPCLTNSAHALESSGDGVFDTAERKTREHNDMNEVEAITDSAGQSLANDYDDRGAMRAQPLPPDPLTASFYDGDWNLLEEVEWVDEAAPGDADLVRQNVWDPTAQNEQAQSMARDGGGYGPPLPVWAATDRQRDVVALYYDLFGATAFARMRYSPYGQPEPVIVGDLDGDGALSHLWRRTVNGKVCLTRTLHSRRREKRPPVRFDELVAKRDGLSELQQRKPSRQYRLLPPFSLSLMWPVGRISRWLRRTLS